MSSKLFEELADDATAEEFNAENYSNSDADQHPRRLSSLSIPPYERDEALDEPVETDPSP